METESSEPVSTENKMGTMKMGKLIAQLTIPSIVAQIVNLLYNIVDRIYIGHIPEIGAAALTGAGLFMPILLLINASASLVCAGGAPLLGIALGKKDEEKAEKIMGNCFSLLLVLGIVLTPALFFSASPLLTFFGASEATLPYALPYAQIYILGTILVMITYGMNLFISAQGYAVTSMLSVAIGAAINIGLDPLLMFTFNMGGEGSGDRDRDLPRGERALDSAFPLLQTQQDPHQGKGDEMGEGHPASLPASRPIFLHHDLDRKHRLRLLQPFPFEVRRRLGGRGNDHHLRSQ